MSNADWLIICVLFVAACYLWGKCVARGRKTQESDQQALAEILGVLNTPSRPEVAAERLRRAILKDSGGEVPAWLQDLSEQPLSKPRHLKVVK